VVVIFPDEAAKEQASVLSVFVILEEEGIECGALMDGTAGGYRVERWVEIQLPAPEEIPSLSSVGSGPRLFYAYAEDSNQVLVLRGCTRAEAGADGETQIKIALQWVN